MSLRLSLLSLSEKLESLTTVISHARLLHVAFNMFSSAWRIPQQDLLMPTFLLLVSGRVAVVVIDDLPQYSDFQFLIQ